jgi:hypothetical protein
MKSQKASPKKASKAVNVSDHRTESYEEFVQRVPKDAKATAVYIDGKQVWSPDWTKEQAQEAMDKAVEARIAARKG